MHPDDWRGLGPSPVCKQLGCTHCFFSDGISRWNQAVCTEDWRWGLLGRRRRTHGSRMRGDDWSHKYNWQCSKLRMSIRARGGAHPRLLRTLLFPLDSPSLPAPSPSLDPSATASPLSSSALVAPALLSPTASDRRCSFSVLFSSRCQVLY